MAAERERRCVGGESQRLEDDASLALKTREGAMSPGGLVASGSWKRPGNGVSLLGSLREHDTWISTQCKLCQTSDL